MSHVGAGSNMQCFAGDAPTIFKISSAVTGRKLDRAGNCLGSITGGLALDVDKRILLTLFWKKSANSSGENLQSDVALGLIDKHPDFDPSAAGSFMFEDNVLDQYSVYCSRSTNRRYWDWERQALNDSSLFFLRYTCSSRRVFCFLIRQGESYHEAFRWAWSLTSAYGACLSTRYFNVSS